MSTQLIYTVIAMAGLTLFVYVAMTVAGFVAHRRGELDMDYALTKTGAPPPAWAANWGRNLANLTELPVLFYPVALLPLALPETINATHVWLAWAFVASRYAHTIVHVTINHLGLRFLTHRIGALILIAMWVNFALKV
ncbi:MAG: MAPEG family protein [Maricaulaceae bacterium]|nr:MAPEG family protein [Maricaulaceae bacterium]